MHEDYQSIMTELFSAAASVRTLELMAVQAAVVLSKRVAGCVR